MSFIDIQLLKKPRFLIQAWVLPGERCEYVSLFIPIISPAEVVLEDERDGRFNPCSTWLL